ncbi:hypothetical protein AB4K20DRAFT_1872948, partial [Rhizopus microsporus]
RRKEHQECHLDEFKYISELPTLKTANLTSFLLAASTRLQNYQRIHNYYCQDKWYVTLLHGIHFNNVVSRLISTSKKELKRLLKDSLTTAKNMAYQAQLALKTKTQTKANMYHYLLLTSLSPLNGSGLLSLKMVLFVQV